MNTQTPNFAGIPVALPAPIYDLTYREVLMRAAQALVARDTPHAGTLKALLHEISQREEAHRSSILPVWLQIEYYANLDGEKAAQELKTREEEILAQAQKDANLPTPTETDKPQPHNLDGAYR